MFHCATRTVSRAVLPSYVTIPRRAYKFPPRIIDIKNEGKHGDKVEIKGWVRSHRVQRNVGFLEVNDGSCVSHLQVVGTGEDFKHVLNGCCVRIEGTLVDSIGKEQKEKKLKEVQLQKLEVIGTSSEQYPLQPKRHTMEFLREIAHLRARTNTFGAVLRMRNVAQTAIHKYFQENGFIQVHTPILTSSDCEGAGEQFEVSTPKLQVPAQTQTSAKPQTPSQSSANTQNTPKPRTSTPPQNSTDVNNIQNFPAQQNINTQNNNNIPQQLQQQTQTQIQNHFFGNPAYLTVSGQLQAEIYATSMSRVYVFGPTFRAEHSHTTRHLAEFWMVEPEMAFADLPTNIGVAEDFVKFLVKHVLENSAEDLEFLQKWVEPNLLKTLRTVVDEPFAKMTYTEAVKLLQESGQKFSVKVQWGDDLGREHEKYLTEHVNNKPLFVTDYPAKIKPFYMRGNEDGKTVACMDLLVPDVGELIGGSAREERHDVLLERLNAMNMNADTYTWYTDLRKFGTVPHAGFGMGFERFIQFVTGVKNIKDVIPIPRHTGYCKF